MKSLTATELTTLEIALGDRLSRMAYSNNGVPKTFAPGSGIDVTLRLYNKVQNIILGSHEDYRLDRVPSKYSNLVRVVGKTTV